MTAWLTNQANMQTKPPTQHVHVQDVQADTQTAQRAILPLTSTSQRCSV